MISMNPPLQMLLGDYFAISRANLLLRSCEAEFQRRINSLAEKRRTSKAFHYSRNEDEISGSDIVNQNRHGQRLHRSGQQHDRRCSQIHENKRQEREHDQDL